MRTLPLLGLLILAVLAAAHRGGRWSKSYRRSHLSKSRSKSTLSPAAEHMLAMCEMTPGCNRIPSSKCLLDLATFNAMVVDSNRLSVYQIWQLGGDEPILPYQLRYKYVGGPTMLEYQVSFRTTPNEDYNCIMNNAPDFATLVEPSSTAAVYNVAIDYGTDAGVEDGRMYFLSDHLDRYLITFFCHDRTTIETVATKMWKGQMKTKEICNGDFHVDISVNVATQAPPDTVDWKSLEINLNKCLGLNLNDTRNHFLLSGTDCDDP